MAQRVEGISALKKLATLCATAHAHHIGALPQLARLLGRCVARQTGYACAIGKAFANGASAYRLIGLAL
jgi:hypothetical protein